MYNLYNDIYLTHMRLIQIPALMNAYYYGN